MTHQAKDFGYEKDLIANALQGEEDQALDDEYDKLRTAQDFGPLCCDAPSELSLLH